MKTRIGTLAILVTLGLAPAASADDAAKLGLTLEPVDNEGEIQQLMVQNRARIQARYRALWQQAEAGDQDQRAGDDAATTDQNRYRHQVRHQTRTGEPGDGAGTGDRSMTRSRTQLRQELRSQVRSVLRAQRDADQLAAELRYQTRERERAMKQGTTGERAGAGQQTQRRQGGHGR